MIVNNEAFGDTSKRAKNNPFNEDPFFTSVYALVEALLHNNSTYFEQQDNEKHKNPTTKKTDSAHFHNYTHGAQKLGGSGWHIDGMERGQFGSFSLLIGFPLSDQYEDFSGNLCLHAGSHHVLNTSYVKSYAEKCVEVNGGKQPSEQQEVRIPKPKLEEPVQVKAGRGDCVFVLHKVGHRGGPNYSNN
eukprot:gene35757-44092_t